MISNKLTLLLVIMSQWTFSQIKGIVKDSLTRKPIFYANIWVENENVGVSSEEDGTFSISTDSTKKLVFSALGYHKKKMTASSANEVLLNPQAYEIEEVVVTKKLETRVIEIGKSKTPIYQAFDNGPRIDVKFFPYLTKYKKTRNIRQVTVETDSKIDDATIKIHFYSVDSNGYPGEELLKKDFITTVKKGVNKNVFDISGFNLLMPKKGLFVGFEKLIIEKNKVETTITDYNSNTTKIKKNYYPFVLYNFEERECIFSFSGGKWNKDILHDSNGISMKRMVNEPAINLILTN
ncbi:carboxypeptidase-like regulatory domain-containing protein [Flavobacterium aciduliphilum]|uniref:Carboxypeptidase-like protein n=1 Tax=Flavobacterium aciduliphilum TaxID=1101402 RepID=A0A328YIL5_9FLAO|nr:carboxypeptidase-like regulatory domain-containing protein [Flavobacterium aciduliphilum]RAR72893.1 carboxypeptidase-like protein [Flavobacterium aciduliphilum]